jgi:hypothetical protein
MTTEGPYQPIAGTLCCSIGSKRPTQATAPSILLVVVIDNLLCAMLCVALVVP